MQIDALLKSALIENISGKYHNVKFISFVKVSWVLPKNAQVSIIFLLSSIVLRPIQTLPSPSRFVDAQYVGRIDKRTVVVIPLARAHIAQWLGSHVNAVTLEHAWLHRETPDASNIFSTIFVISDDSNIFETWLNKQSRRMRWPLSCRDDTLSCWAATRWVRVSTAQSSLLFFARRFTWG